MEDYYECLHHKKEVGPSDCLLINYCVVYETHTLEILQGRMSWGKSSAWTSAPLLHGPAPYTYIYIGFITKLVFLMLRQPVPALYSTHTAAR